MKLIKKKLYILIYFYRYLFLNWLFFLAQTINLYFHECITFPIMHIATIVNHIHSKYEVLLEIFCCAKFCWTLKCENYKKPILSEWVFFSVQMDSLHIHFTLSTSLPLYNNFFHSHLNCALLWDAHCICCSCFMYTLLSQHPLPVSVTQAFLLFLHSSDRQNMTSLETSTRSFNPVLSNLYYKKKIIF